MRSLPDDNTSNPVAAVVYWFYTSMYGRKPDSTLYKMHSSRKYPRALVHLLNPEEEGAQKYLPSEIGELVWYLIDNGVEVKNLNIVSIPGLMYSYANRREPSCAKELRSFISWLIKDQSGNQQDETQSYSRFSGWAG